MNKGIIFDVDGTILDSMKIWMDAGKIYLDKFGIEEKENIAEVLFDLTMAEGAKYIKETLDAHKSIEEPTLEEILEVDRWTREYVKSLIK